MKFKKNMGFKDRSIRLVLALLIAVLYFTQVITGVVALLLLVIMGILIGTSYFMFCPLYYPFKINTAKKRRRKKNRYKY
jgi:fatty acid desaturase